VSAKAARGPARATRAPCRYDARAGRRDRAGLIDCAWDRRPGRDRRPTFSLSDSCCVRIPLQPRAPSRQRLRLISRRAPGPSHFWTRRDRQRSHLGAARPDPSAATCDLAVANRCHPRSWRLNLCSSRTAQRRNHQRTANLGRSWVGGMGLHISKTRLAGRFYMTAIGTS
jgi:hypothetical protein